MRVLIVLAKYRYPSDSFATPVIFPQGPAYIAGALELAGHEVRGLNIANDTPLVPIEAHLRTELARAISEFQPDLVALGGLSADYPFIRDTLKFCRELCPDLPVCLGGGIVTADQDFIFGYLRPDFAIVGEGEVAMVQLVEHLAGKRAVSEVDNLLYWKAGSPAFNPGSGKDLDINALPYPSYASLGIEEFFRASSHRDAHHLTGSALWPRIFPVSAGRSCPFRCTFCFHSSGASYRQRPIPDVLEEVAYFYEKFRFNILSLYDELFSVREDRVLEFCEGWQALKLPIKWTCALRVPDITPKMARALKRAGAFMVGLGLESASDVVLRSMKKQISKAQIERAFAILQQEGMGLQGNFIFGDPAETEATMAETIEFFRRESAHCLHLDRIAPYPGSEIFQTSLEDGRIPDKRQYYESIGTCSSINLTGLADELYDRKVREVIALDMELRPLAPIREDVFIVERPHNKPHLITRKHLVCQVVCPHCNEAHAYNYSIHPRVEGAQELKRVLPKKPFVLCRHCEKLFRIEFDAPLRFHVVQVAEDQFPGYEELEQALQPEGHSSRHGIGALEAVACQPFPS